MKKYTVISIVFFSAGLILFAIAWYAFRSYKDFLALFDYYGIPERIYASRPDNADIIFNFKYGIIKYLILGITAWAVSAYFFVRRLKNEQKND